MDTNKLEDQMSYILADINSAQAIIKSFDYVTLDINNSELLYAIRVLTEHSADIIHEVTEDIVEFRKKSKEITE